MRLRYSRVELIPIGCALTLAIASLAGVARGDAKDWWTFAFFALCVLMLLAAPTLRARREQALAKAAPRLIIDSIGVRRVTAETIEAVGWDELSEVWIVTTSAGPFMDDVFFVLHGAGENGIVIPLELAVEHKLLNALQARLPDLDGAAIVSAMACTADARFVIWPPQQAQ